MHQLHLYTQNAVRRYLKCDVISSPRRALERRILYFRNRILRVSNAV